MYAVSETVTFYMFDSSHACCNEKLSLCYMYIGTTQPLYNTIVGVHYFKTISVLTIQSVIFTGCFLRPDMKRFCLTFTIGPDRIWFCLISVSDFFLQSFLEFGQRFDLILNYDVN